jgi:hypothetical protein
MWAVVLWNLQTRHASFARHFGNEIHAIDAETFYVSLVLKPSAFPGAGGVYQSLCKGG